MSGLISPATGKRYGIKRACDALGFPRSSFYLARQPKADKTPEKRGPKTQWSDGDLLGFIRRDLDRSLFQGEGHRKVWARLRVMDGLRVSRKRILRIMREHCLLSPHRGRQAPPLAHEGTLATDAPNVMWGTDGSRVLTRDDGWVWVFAALEHFNSECVGHYVSKMGTRFQALEPVAMGITDIFGGVEAGAARGLALRMDHGSQYLADHFQNQIRFWGIAPSFAFVSQPQTNGIAERFFRTLKEQAIHGRMFRNVEEVREAVDQFIQNYNSSWRLERLNYMSPVEYREYYLTKLAA